MDLTLIFHKDPSTRKDTENDAVDIFIKSTEFFDNIFNPKFLIRNFTEEIYATGDNLYDFTNKKVHIIVKGQVLLDSELRIGPYNAIGEFQMIEHKNLDIIASEKVNVISINEEGYRTLFLHSRLKQSKKISPMLSKISFFEDIKQMRLEKISTIAIPIQYDQNQEVYHLGDTSKYFFLVFSGKVELSYEVKLESTYNLPIGFKKREKLVIEKNYFQPIVTVSENEVFGLYEASNFNARKVSVKTIVSTTLYAIK